MAGAYADGDDLGTENLAIACFPTKLDHRFHWVAEPVQPSRRHLATPRVDRQLPVGTDARSTIDERTRLAVGAEPEGLQPQDRCDAEPVVELGEMHIRRPQAGARPELSGGVEGCHGCQVIP